MRPQSQPRQRCGVAGTRSMKRTSSTRGASCMNKNPHTAHRILRASHISSALSPALAIPARLPRIRTLLVSPRPRQAMTPKPFRLGTAKILKTVSTFAQLLTWASARTVPASARRSQVDRLGGHRLARRGRQAAQMGDREPQDALQRRHRRRRHPRPHLAPQSATLDRHHHAVPGTLTKTFCERVSEPIGSHLLASAASSCPPV